MAAGLRSLLAWVAIFFAALIAADVDPVVIKGSHFFYQTNGSEFIIRGVTYQPSSSSANEQADPLGSLTTSDCMRDIPYLTQLTTNVIRVSYIDPTQDHHSCMDQLQQAGIYVLVDLPTNLTINSSDPTWNLDIYNSWTQRIDALAEFKNVLGFFAGNDIVTNSSNSPAAAFVKAAVRDLKTYMISKNYRKIPVGYEINAADNYVVVPLYMTCGGNASAAIDFLGISDFNLCSNNISSSFESLTELYGSYPAPVFFADYGCRDTAGDPRQFEEVQYIYGNSMANITSGGIVYEYFSDDEGNGLISTSGAGVIQSPDFTSYSSQIAKITPHSTFASNYVATNTVTPSCPTGASFSASPTLPPVVNQNVCACMMETLSCIAIPGLDSATALLAYQDICGASEDCRGVSGNGATGTYGAFSMCNITERLSWALNLQNLTSDFQCENDANALTQEPQINPTTECSEVMAEAGFDGTGTVTTFPTGPIDPGPPIILASEIPEDSVLSQGEIAGITVGSIGVLALIVAGAVWFFCKRGCCGRKRRSMYQSAESIGSESPDQTRGRRGGGDGTSFLSDDSRGMVEMLPGDERYLGSRSNTEVQSSRDEGPGHGLAGGASAYLPHQRQHSPTLQHSEPKLAKPISTKELPAFRRQDQPEEKSLASIKFLSPVVRPLPAQAEEN